MCKWVLAGELKSESLSESNRGGRGQIREQTMKDCGIDIEQPRQREAPELDIITYRN
jgi:hypothetical protein